MRASLFGILAVLGIAGFAGSSLAADVVAPEPALINDGYLELFADYTFLGGNFGSEDDDFFAGGAALRWNLPLSDMVSLQLDGNGELTENSGGDDNDLEDTLGGAAHLSYRDPESWLLGIFGGAQYADDGDNGDVLGFFIGGEGQLYWDQNTFYLQAGYLDGGENDSNDNIFTSTFFARGQFRHYFTENVRAALGLGYADGRVDEEKNTEVIDWAAEVEWKPEDYPVTLFAAYEGMDMDQRPGESDHLDEHVIKLGLRYDFGSYSIFERDRLGAGLDTPRFGRWLGEANGPLE